MITSSDLMGFVLLMEFGQSPFIILTRVEGTPNQSICMLEKYGPLVSNTILCPHVY